MKQKLASIGRKKNEFRNVCGRCNDRNDDIRNLYYVDGGKEMKINDFMQEVHENAVAHGWWDEERTFGDIIALCHSELSEALEEYRKGYEVDEMYYKGFKPEGVSLELADCIIRILDYCGHEGIDIENAIKIKHKYNKTRPFRHGNKTL